MKMSFRIIRKIYKLAEIPGHRFHARTYLKWRIEGCKAERAFHYAQRKYSGHLRPHRHYYVRSI